MEAILYNRYRSLEEDDDNSEEPKNLDNLVESTIGAIIGFFLFLLIVFTLIFVLSRLAELLR